MSEIRGFLARLITAGRHVYNQLVEASPMVTFDRSRRFWPRDERPLFIDAQCEKYKLACARKKRLASRTTWATWRGKRGLRCGLSW